MNTFNKDVFNQNIFNKNIFNQNIFNKDIFNKDIFNKNVFTQEAFKQMPFVVDTFDPTPFNKIISSVKQAPSVKTPESPIDTFNYYGDILTKLKYKRYLINERMKRNGTYPVTKTESNLIDYNNPLEINSLRDIIFGSLNPYMNKGSTFAPWNFIVNFYSHLYKHYGEPTLKGDFRTVGLNILMGIGEDLDVLANPVKATVISAYKGDPVGQALIRSTFGDTTGIHNYDYDTGNKLTDIVLEFLSDPITLIELASGVGLAIKGGSKVATVTAKGAAKELASETGEKLLKTSSKRLSRSTGIEITKEAISESTEAAIKQLPFKSFTKNGELWKEYISKKVSAVKKEIWNKLIRSNSWDDIAEEYNKNFTKIFANELSMRTGADPTKIIKALDNTKYGQTFMDTIDDLVKGAYNASSVAILSSIYNKVEFIDDAYTSTIFKAALTPIGVYPVWRILKNDSVQEFLHLQTFRKVQQVEINRNLVATDNAFKKLGNYSGVVQTVDKDLTVRAAFDATNKYIGPQEALDFLGPRLKQNLDGITKILNNKRYSLSTKKDAIINILQSYDSYNKINSIDDFVNMLERLQKQIKKVDGVELNTTGLEDYIQQFKKLKGVIDTFETAEEATKKLKLMEYDTSVTNVIKQLDANEVFDNYSTKDIIKAIDYQEVLRLLGIDENLIFTLKKLGNANKEYFKKSGFNINIIDYLENAVLDPTTKSNIIDNLVKRINQLQVKGRYDWVSKSPINRDLNYLSGVLKGLQNNVGYSVKDNWDKLINRLTEMIQNPKYTLNGTLDYKTYRNTFFPVINNLEYPIREPLIAQLSRQLSFIPSETAKFKDTNLAHYVQSVDNKYNKLRDIVDDINKTVKEYTENPDINMYDSNVAQRIKDLHTINNVPMTDVMHQQYTIPEVHEITQRVIKNIPLLKAENVEQIEPYFENLIQYCYDNKIHLSENALLHLENISTALKRLNKYVNDINKGDPNMFNALYEGIHNTYNDLMREYSYVKRVFDKPNVLSFKTDFRKVLYDTDINTFNKNVTPKTIQDARAYFKTQLDMIPMSWEDFNFNGKQLKSDYNKYIAEDKAWKESIRQELAKFDKYAGQENRTLTDILTPEEYAYYFNPDTQQYALSELMDQIANELDFGLLEEKVITVQTNNNILLLQLEHWSQQAILNTDPVLQQMRQTPIIRELVTHIADADHPVIKDLYKNFSNDDKKILGTFAAVFKGIDNVNRLMKEVDNMVNHLFKDDLPNGLNLKQAIYTTLINYKNKRARTILSNIDNIIQEVVYGMQGNINGMDIFAKKHNMDILIDKYKLKPIIEKELKDAGLDYAYRHSALYDTAAQILAWEKIYNKPYSGIMIDIETSGLVDPAKIAHGNITDITMMKRGLDGKLEIVYDGRVRLAKEQIENGFIPEPDVLKNMKIKNTEYINYHKVLENEINEEEVLKGFWANLLCISEDTQLDTFNGSDFDWIFLDSKLTDYNIPGGLTKYDLQRRINNLVFSNEQLRVKPDLNGVLERLNVQDFYKDLAKDRYQISSSVALKIKKLIKDQAIRQLELEKFTPFTGISPRFISSVDTNFLDNLVEFIKLDDLKYAKPNLNMIDIPDIVTDLIPEEYIEKYLNIKDLMIAKGMNTNLIKDSLDPEIKKWLISVYDSVTNQMSEIGTLNRSWRQIPIAESFFNENRRLGYSTGRSLEVQNLIADSLENSKLNVSQDIINQLRTTPMTNLTQLATVGLQDRLLIGYRKLDANRLLNLDLDAIYTTESNLRTLDTFNRAVHNTYINIKNNGILQEYQPQIKDALKQIKESKLIIEASALPLHHKDLMYNYSLLETIYHKLKRISLMDNSLSNPAKQLLNNLDKQYPNLSLILDSKIPSIRVSLNGDKLLYSLPDYLDPKYMDYAKLLSTKEPQLNALNKVQALIDTSRYPLGQMQRTKTAGMAWQDLWQMYHDTYINGLPTALTKKYQSVGVEYQRVLYAWETHSFLNLTPEDIRTYIIYANRDHIINIKRPTNAYFNNEDLFALFANKKEALDELGVKWKYDNESNILTLKLDPSVKVAVNKNYNKTIYYTLNDEELPSIVLPEINKNDLYSYVFKNLEDLEGIEDIKTIKEYSKIKDYIDKMSDLRERLVQMNPELSGHPGLVNVKETYITVRNDPLLPHFNTPKIFNGDNYMSYFNMDMLGEIKDVMENTHYFNADYFETLTGLSNKMINHSEKHLDYGQFIMEGGLNLNSKALSKMSTQDIVDMLKSYPELTLVYLKDNPKSLGGFEIKKVNAYTLKILEEAKKLNATIVPYNIYAEAANVINQYTYGNYATAIWHKVISLYKRSWLMNIGTIFRNGVDSTMKTFAEGRDVPGTMSSYTKAFDLLNKYDKVAREIKSLDPHGRYRLDLAENYFNTKPNTLLDKDTYHFIYDFMEHSGMNTLTSTVDGAFGLAMKPMSDIERISRFAMYLTLENQGESYAEIIRRIAQTHFDYGLKTQAQFIAENYIPFVTYVTNNICYLVHLVEENPSFLKNYFNIYQPIWNFDSYNYDELSENTSLQYQILNGNLPLDMFGFKDKKIKRTVNTKYGPREQEVTNTAVIRMGSSILDALQFFVNPYYNIKEKLAPPNQLIADTVTEFSQAALGNSNPFEWKSYLDTDAKYQKDFGSTSVQALFRDPSNIVSLIPYLNVISQRYMHKDSNNNLALGSTTGERTQNPLLGILSSTFGATNRWGEFKNNYKTNNYSKKSYLGYSKTYIKKPKRFYVKRYYPSKSYYYNKTTYYPNALPNLYNSMSRKTPYSKYATFIYNAARPNNRNVRVNTNNNLPRLQSIPQYLHSYNGLNRYGKSKLLSWMRMSTRYKVKSTLKRQVRARSLYSKV